MQGIADTGKPSNPVPRYMRETFQAAESNWDGRGHFRRVNVLRRGSKEKKNWDICPNRR